MPHVVLEYSTSLEDSLNMSACAQAAHQVMLQSELFAPQAVKTRCNPAEHALVGEQGADGQFVHVTISLLEGRDDVQKAALTQAMFDRLRPMIADKVSVSVDVRDMIKKTYRK